MSGALLNEVSCLHLVFLAGEIGGNDALRHSYLEIIGARLAYRGYLALDWTERNEKNAVKLSRVCP